MSSTPPFVFILSWERPIYTWVCLDSLYRTTKSPANFVIGDNASQDPLVREVITGFERRGMFHAVHYYPDNDAVRLGKMVEQYWSEIGEYLVFIESDISVQNTPKGWLKTITDHMDADPTIGSVGSRVFKYDFVKPAQARKLAPDLDDAQLTDLIKGNAPMRKYEPTDEPLISPHNPPLRLLVMRKTAYADVGFGRDFEIHKWLKAKGWKSLISTEVAHRHLTLLNIFDNPDYDTTSRNEFFNFHTSDDAPKPLVSKPATPPVVQPESRENAVLVLGMHRSGTSCLAGSLEQAGLYLGDVVTSAPHNQKGNRENKAAMTLHEEVLRSNGGSWDAPSETVAWSAAQLKTLDDLIETYPRTGLWGIKDPRMLFVHDAWLPRLTAPRYVGSIRHPLEVVKSVQTRNPKKYKDAAPLFALWYAYNRRLMDHWTASPFPIVNFNCSEADYAAQIDRAATSLGLPGVPADAVPFFEGGLRHQAHDDSDLPAHVADLYAQLVQASDGSV